LGAAFGCNDGRYLVVTYSMYIVGYTVPLFERFPGLG
jgi:hypothetical protein